MTHRGYLLTAIGTFILLALGNQGYVQFRRISCWSGGYSQNAWMAYCNSDQYGVYDVEAVWFESETEISQRLATAKVLTLTDSHLQNALSLGNADQWFSSHHYPVYMLGLPTAESGFGLRILEKFKPHPAVVVFDASPYFSGRMGRFEQILAEVPAGERERVFKLHDFQSFHYNFCEKWNWLCDRNFAYFRSRDDGHWIFPQKSGRFLIGTGSIPNDEIQFATATRPDELLDKYPEYLTNAEDFVEHLNISRECIVITAVPTEWPKADLAKYLAKSLGVSLVAPELPDMKTFDKSHLTPESSKRWSQAFLTGLEPILKKCDASSN